MSVISTFFKADQPAPRRDNKHRIQSEIVKPAAKDEPLRSVMLISSPFV